MTAAHFAVRVGAEYACFSRPEFKVERVTYPVITPSAARGVLEAIFWKPEIGWEVREIALLKPIRHTTLLRNELADRQGTRPFFVEDKRQQRASLILKDVEYVLRAELVLRPHAEGPITKYADQVRRRLDRGQFHHAPYLGNREFSAWFEVASGSETPAPVELDIGLMLFDIAFREDPGRPEVEFHRHGPDGRRRVKGYAEAVFFAAEVRGGVLRVPPEKYRELYSVAGGHAS